jgi:glutathione S-transferase
VLLSCPVINYFAQKINLKMMQAPSNQGAASSSMKGPGALTLYFLPMRAQAEAVRMILHYGEIEFEDVIVSVIDWETVKTASDIAPFGQLPSLRLPSGEIIAQTGSIIRYVAKLAKIYPEDPVLAARADMIYEFAQDLNSINPIVNFWPVITEDWTNAYKSYFGELARNLQIAQNYLGYEPFFGGNTPHHGDFEMFHIFDLCLLVNPACLDEFPLLQAFYHRMKDMPVIQHYLTNRSPPQTIGLCGSYVQTHIAKNVGHHH